MSASVHPLQARIQSVKGTIRKADESSESRAERCRDRARWRIQTWLATRAESGRALAEDMAVDESSLRKAAKCGVGLALPVWLEALIEENPEAALDYLETLVNDAIDRKVAIGSGR
jgi:hypothetical protein